MTSNATTTSAGWGRRLARLFTRRGSPTAAPTASEHPRAVYHDDPDPEFQGLDDPRSAIAFGYWVIIAGIGSFIFWAATAPIAEGVSAPGVVVVESRRKVITHLTGGTVNTVTVSENQIVKAGDVLLTLDSTRAQAAYDGLLGDYVAASARLERLVAEQRFAPRLEFPEQLTQQAEKIGRNEILLAQLQLFRTRQQAYRSEQAILGENLGASSITATGLRQQLVSRRQQIELLQREIETTRPLVEAGFSARNRLLEQERQLAELTSTLSDLQARVAREGSSSAEIRLRTLQRRQEYLKEVETQVTEARREVASLGERLKDAQLELDRTTVRAPVSGQVIALTGLAAGSVVTPGSRLMEVVPTDDKLLLDVQVPIQVAHRIRPGLATDIRVTAFPESPNLVIEGIVRSISADRHEPQGLPPYYLARIEVSPDGVAKLRGRRLHSGMSSDIVIKTGERSFFTYLMSPINRRLFESFREP